MARLGVTLGALILALAVAGGAFGAHGLRSRLDPRELELWETAVRYFILAGFGILGTGLLQRTLDGAPVGLDVAVGLLLFGGVVFSGTVATIALGGPRWLGAVTPLGGLGLIAGFLVLALAAFRA